MTHNAIATAILTHYRTAFLHHGPTRYAVMQPQASDRKYSDFDGSMSDRQIAQHLAGHAAYAVPLVAHGLANLLALDIDAGGMEAATALLAAASARALWAFATVDPTRQRGYVYVPFAELVNAARIRELGDQLISTVQQPHYRIENRTHGADTRLPFARHQWNQKRGLFLNQAGLMIDLDDETHYSAILTAFFNTYQPNSTDHLPPAPEAPASQRASGPVAAQGSGITISRYNERMNLVDLLISYGARAARGKGQKLYFCPFHADDHASLMLTRDGQRCKCLSATSGCPLADQWHDAFNVFCTGEELTPQQALRRINGLTDDPTPQTGPQRATSSPQSAGSIRTRPVAPRTPSATKTPPTTPPAAPRAPEASEPDQDHTRTSATSGQRLPKTCKRLLSFLAAQRTYRRGIPHLARLLDCDERTIRRSLRRLEALGHVQRHERGRDGQTDIYTYHGEGGGHLPPTVDIRSLLATELDLAERGGQPDCQPSATGSVLEQASADDAQAGQQASGPDGELYGPAGAIAYPGGAAYVPPAAEAWYNALLQQARIASYDDAPAPEQASGPELSAPAPEPPPQRASPPKKRRKPAPSVDQLKRRIYAAEAKAARLAASGTKQAKRQAKAIRHAAESLRHELAYRLSVTEEPAPDAQAGQQASGPAASAARATAPPLSYDAVGLIRRLQERHHAPHSATAPRFRHAHEFGHSPLPDGAGVGMAACSDLAHPLGALPRGAERL